jgi:phage tail sheath protein FI
VLDDARDIADLSYVAVYHPWLLVRDLNAPDRLRPIPPDGAVCGTIAAREHERQVWVAPANLPLTPALGLVPPISDDDWADLFALQFNLVRPEPRDFRVMSAHTLADERSLLQISVRRLMILLRKAALERGMDFVFETNHERFREGVRVVLEDLLRFMFERGAFAGATPAEAYRVVTDASVNTPQSVDQGRFIALIQVAPSQPLEFVTVLLTRTDPGTLLSVEG